MKRIFFLTAAVVLLSGAFAEPSLSAYLNNDLELQRLAYEVKKAEISNKTTSIENGLDVILSTGTASFKVNDDGSSVSFTPSAKISVPQVQNLSVQASSKIKVANGSNNTADTSISMEIDIISGAGLSRKIALMKSERALLEAKRALQNRALEAEKEYFSELKSLLSSASNIASLKRDMYEDTVSFEEVKAKGYSTGSAKYRQAEMKVISEKHDIEKKVMELEHDCVVFAAKCGKDYVPGTTTDSFLPSEVPVIHPVDITSFSKDSYTKIESAKYKQQLAEMQRKAEKNFSLSATAGYTFKNSNTSFSSEESKADTIDAGLNATYKGLAVGAGINIPANGSNPTYTANASIKPNTFRLKNLKAQTDSYNRDEEIIAIKAAEDDYNTDFVDKQSELNDIKWAKQTNSETYDLYIKLEKDMGDLLKQGLVKETEYLNASVNKRMYQIKLMINDLDLIIYNNSTKLLFCRDEEIQD